MNKQQFHYVTLAVLLTTLIFQVHPLLPSSLPAAHAANRSITLQGFTPGWNGSNPVVTVVQGDTITMTVSSGDSAQHRFSIDVDRSGVSFSPSCPPDKCSDVVPPTTSFSFNIDFAPGNYTYYCTFHTGSMRGTWAVQGFTINSVPSSLRVPRGSSNMSTITVTSVNGFSGDVNLFATVSPTGPTATLNPSSVTVSTSPQTSTLTVSTISSTPVGSYVVNVTGTSGSTSTSVNVSTSVVGPDFSIGAIPSTLTIPLGSSQTSNVTVGSLHMFTGSIDLSTSVLPTGISVIFTPNPVLLPADGTATSTMNVTSAPSTVPGTYMVDVAGTNSSLQHTTTVTIVAGPDFGIASSPSLLNVTRTQSGTSTITVTSFNSFSGTVDLTSTNNLTGGPGCCGIRDPRVTVLSGGTATAILIVNASATIPAGTYTIAVTGSSGAMSHSTIVTVSVQDFSITLSVNSLTLTQGSSGTATISLASVNGFTGNVGLATTASLSSISLLLNATTISLSPSKTSFASLTLNVGSVSTGTYAVTVTGTVGSLVHSASISITVPPPVVDGARFNLAIIAAVVVIAAIAVMVVYLLRRGRSRKLGPQQG